MLWPCDGLSVCSVLYNLDPIQGQGQGHGAFELPKISESVHAGGDDRQPPLGAFYTVNHKKRDILFLTISLANLNRFL